MKSKVYLDKSNFLAKALGSGLSGLAYLVTSTWSMEREYDFFSHLCNFTVPYIRKSSLLQPLREQWTDERNEHARKARHLESMAIREITDASNLLEERLKAYPDSIHQQSLSSLEKIQRTLKDGGEYLGTPFYQLACNDLNSLCRSLADSGEVDLLEGLADIGYRDSYTSDRENPTLIKEPCLERVHFCSALSELYDHQKLTKHDRLDVPWVVWEQLCLAEQCWHLPQSYFDEQDLCMGSPENVRKLNQLFSLRGYWHEMQCIRQKHQGVGQRVCFATETYKAYLNHIVSAIVYWHSLRQETPSKAKLEPIYSLELRLDGNELHLLVEEQKDGARATYLLHNCQDGAAPLLFIKQLLGSVGTPVEVPDTSPGSQSVAKLLSSLKLNSQLRRLFFESGTTTTTTLKCTRAVIAEHTGIDTEELDRQIRSLKLLSGALSLIDYEQVNI